MALLLLGIASSLATEIVTWINKKLSGTVIHGRGAFLFSFVIALIIATAQVVIRRLDIDLSVFVATVSAIFGASQVWFHLIAKNLGLTVEPSR